LKGVIVKIGGAGDPSYLLGCYGIHFDYAASEPDRVQWSCVYKGDEITKLGPGGGPPAAMANGGAGAAPGPPPPFAPPPPPGAVGQAGQGGADVVAGTYECYGDGDQLGGFNFTITGPGQYADIQGTAGSYSMAAGMLTFHGGAHDGERATFFPGPDVRNPPHITFENVPGAGLGISCDHKA
jgi:hypothetical protein